MAVKRIPSGAAKHCHGSSSFHVRHCPGCLERINGVERAATQVCSHIYDIYICVDGYRKVVLSPRVSPCRVPFVPIALESRGAWVYWYIGALCIGMGW